MAASTSVGAISVTLHCKACGTTIGPRLTDGVIDDEGDLAVPYDSIAWFMEAHYQPEVLF